MLFALTACGKTITHDRPVKVHVPVPQSCALPRPIPIPNLRTAYSDAVWKAMDARQKAAAVGKHALELRTYAEQLFASTAACP